MKPQRTISLWVISLLLVSAPLESGLCGTEYHDVPKVTYVVDVPATELDDLRAFVHALSIKWNVRNDDASYKFPAGHGYIINTLMQRPDGLKARFLGGINGSRPTSDAVPSVRLTIACDPPCQDWSPFAKALEAEVSHRWKVTIYQEPTRAPPN